MPDSAPKSWTSTALLITALSLPVAYSAVTECYRYYVIRQRHHVYMQFLRNRTTDVFGDVRKAIQARFGVLRGPLTGRYLNVTFEWHEQSIYEFFIHQLIWKPLTGRLWWNFGLSKDPYERAEALPSQVVDIELLKRRSWRHRKALEGSPRSGRSAAPSEDWEEVESGAVPSIEPMSVTWLGQSTCIVQMDGLTILTDPVFTDKPMNVPGAPKRLRPPPVSLKELITANVLDICVISHDHPDHLSDEAVRSLAEEVVFVCPIGVRHFFTDRGVPSHNVYDLTWWEERSIRLNGGDLLVACTPAQHWSGRSLLDVNQSLWAGFILKSVKSSRSFFHCGDTGYSSDLYNAVGQIYGPIDLAAIPIGSYSPEWYMKNFHTTPKGAVRIHRQLGIHRSVAVHWGTWMMSDERWDDPPKQLAEQLDLQGVQDGHFQLISTGHTLES